MILETILGIIAWFAIAYIGAWVLWLMASAFAAFMLSSRKSKELNEQDK